MANLFLNSIKGTCNITSSLYGKKRLIILIYHRVLDKPDPMRPGEIDIASFTWQMDLLSNYFHVLSLDEALEGLKKNSLPNRSICVTFDDGYADNYLNALPILLERNLTACFFIATGYLNGGRMWNDTVIESFRNMNLDVLSKEFFDLINFNFDSDNTRARTAQQFIEKIKHLPTRQKDSYIKYLESSLPNLPNDLMLNDLQVKNLRDKGMSIGAHTVTHPILLNQSITEASEELSASRAKLEEITKQSIKYFAYPNGRAGIDYSKEHALLAKEIGFEAAFTTHFGSMTANSNFWQLPRFRPWDKDQSLFMLRISYMFTKTS